MTHLHKMIKSLTKHNFDIKLNAEVHTHETRGMRNLHVADKHPGLQQAIHEYKRLCGEFTHLSCIDTFKFRLKLKYNVISPYLYIN